MRVVTPIPYKKGRIEIIPLIGHHVLSPGELHDGELEPGPHERMKVNLPSGGWVKPKPERVHQHLGRRAGQSLFRQDRDDL